jgi:hypothetical protein
MVWINEIPEGWGCGVPRFAKGAKHGPPPRSGHPARALQKLPWNEGAAAIYNKKCRVQVLFVKSSRGKSDGKSSGTPGRV